MPSVVLISPIGTEITVTSSLAFNQYVYGGGYRPKTGTVEANFAALQGGTTPVPDLTRHISLADLEDDDSDASAVLRAASVSAVQDAIDDGQIVAGLTAPQIAANETVQAAFIQRSALTLGPTPPVSPVFGAVWLDASAIGFLRDTFTAADETLLPAHTADSGQAWINHPTATTGGMKIIAGRACQAISGTTRVISATAAPFADYQVEAKFFFASVPTGTATVAGIGGRFDPTVYTGYYVRYLGGGTGWRLYKQVGTTQTTLGTAAQTVTAGGTYTVILSMVGSTIRVLVDGVEVINVTDTEINGPGRVAVLALGSVGAVGAGTHFDSILARSV